MAVISANGSNGHHKFTLNVTETSVDTANNLSSISWSFVLSPIVTGFDWRYSSTVPVVYSLTIDGTVYSGNIMNYDGSSTVTIRSGSFVTGHYPDGTKDIHFSFGVSSLNIDYLPGSASSSGSMVLTNIPRQAYITSSPNFTDLDNPIVYYSNPAGNAVSSLQACISLTGAKDDISYRDIPKTEGHYQFPLTEAERNVLRNNTTSGSRNVIFFVRTIIGGVTYHSTDTKTFTVVENDNTRPTVTITATLNNGSLPSAFKNMYIQGKSRLNVSISAQGKYSANILSYSANIGGVAYNSQSFLSNVLSKEGKVDVIGYAKDSRQFTGSAKQQIEVVSYSKPLVIPLGSETAIQCYRSDGNGKRVGNSTSVWIKAKRSYYSLSGKNQCALQWRKKLSKDAWNENSSDHKWTDLISKTNTTTNEYSALLPNIEFDLTKSYTVQIMAIDDIGEKDVKTFEIPTQDVALHLGKGGKNVSVGTYCDYSENYTFFSKWKAIFAKGIKGTIIEQSVYDVLDFAFNCEQGFTPIYTLEETINLPGKGNYKYSSGFVMKRTASQICVLLVDFYSGDIAVNMYRYSEWIGWKYLTLQQ